MPNTIKTYTAALYDSNHLAFGIDFQDDFVKFIRAFSLCHPMQTPGQLSWSLDKVLTPLALLDKNSCTLQQLLDTIALASGGLVSKISALWRIQNFTCYHFGTSYPKTGTRLPCQNRGSF